MDDALPGAELYDAVVDDATLSRWVGDLRAFALVDRVMEKGGATRHAGVSTDISASVVRLRAGEIRALQAWYRHEGSAWCDTVLAVPGGWRMVRSRLAPDLH
ncbi:MAG: hypothetical protein FJ102_02020 [Deltaproteobacteria bacterium]|nr:hypothetical protein [Deltaproteobacteria bacterium]